jgi:hypothetical protein
VFGDLRTARYVPYVHLHSPQLTPHPRIGYKPGTWHHYLITTETMNKNNDDDGENNNENNHRGTRTRTRPTPQ